MVSNYFDFIGQRIFGWSKTEKKLRAKDSIESNSIQVVKVAIKFFFFHVLRIILANTCPNLKALPFWLESNITFDSF